VLEEDKFLEIRDKLKSLPQVKASDDFVNALQRKINLIEAEHSASLHKKNVEKIEEGFFSRLFGPARNPWLIPASGFAVVLVLVFAWVFIISKNNGTLTDREDAPQNITSAPGSDTAGKLPVTKPNSTLKSEDIASNDTERETSINSRDAVEPVKVLSDREERSALTPESGTDGVTSEMEDGIIETKTEAPAESNLKMNTSVEQPTSTYGRSAMPKKENEISKDDTSKNEKKRFSAIRRTVQEANDIDKMGLESLQEKVEK
jgi:hypothetical protein